MKSVVRLPLLVAVVFSMPVTGCDEPSRSHRTVGPEVATAESGPAHRMVPPDDGAALVKKLGAKDSIAFVRLDSMKPAMVTIYRCTADDTLYGPELPAQIVLTFPHFPDCRRMQLGSRYLCALRHLIGDDYQLVRSDMLAGAAKTRLYNCFWAAESEEVKRVLKGIGKVD